ISGTSINLLDVIFTDANTGTAVGEYGIILRTTNGGVSFISQIRSEIPDRFSLHQNYPNPFNSQTTIEFDIKRKGDYNLVIYDCLGRKRDEVFNENLNAGSYSVSFYGDELQSGVYFYRLSADGNAMETRKMALIK
ncbi:MAG: T9SS type A sorting domain-containing protein, partial [Ignavibacteria bacterium]|nr:T9SS type A sorting domain-containing protein [Ignavibacteria bacterium]